MSARAPVLPVCPPGSAPAPAPAPPAPLVVLETRGPGGHLLERAETRGGLLDGTTVFYTAAGGEKGRAEFRGGVLHGPMTLRDAEGRVWWSAGYLAGVPDGPITTWQAGVRAETVEYADGRRQGTALTWWPDGTAASSLPYTQDRLEGTAEWFSPAGRKTRSSAYLAGALEGETLDFFPASAAEAVRSRSEYRAGVLHGAVTQYSEDGRALMRAWFDQGHPVWSTSCLWDASALHPASEPDATPALHAPSTAGPTSVVDGTHGIASTATGTPSAHPTSTGDGGHSVAFPSPDPAAPSRAAVTSPSSTAAVPDPLPASADIDAEAGDAPEDGGARPRRSLLSRIVGAWKRLRARLAAWRRGGAGTDLHQRYGR
jgi:antitoxin component YwqK of YwqJK toxin-antitoxin module